MALERADWTLLAIAAAQGAPLSPVQLQKSLFVLGREMPGEVGNFYLFQPYNYGPFDRSVYADVDQMESRGLVTRVPLRQWSGYAATGAGIAAAAALRKDANPRAVDFLDRVVAWTRALSFQDLVRAIYVKYPEMRAKSIFEDTPT